MTKRPLTFAQAKAMYSNRFTMEHVPPWSQDPHPHNGKPRYYAPQYRTDAEWYENTNFPGEDNVPEGFCLSRNQSWPLGEWLSEPYRRQR